MESRIVARGGPATLFALDSYENMIKEGERGELTVTLRIAPPSSLLSALNQALAGRAGVGPALVRGHTVVVPFKKGLGPLALVALAVAVAFAGTMLLLVISWALTVFGEAAVKAAIGAGAILLVLLALGSLGGRDG